MKPYDAKSEKDFISMKSDNFPRDPGKWAILHNGDHISIHSPDGGGWISIPRKQFNAIVDWYTTDQPARDKS